MGTITVRLNSGLNSKLENIAAAIHKSESIIAAHAIAQYIDLYEWQVSEIKQGIKEADTGDLIAHDEITKKWETKLANSLDEESQL